MTAVVRLACLATGLVVLACSDRVPSAPRDSWGPPERVSSKRETRFAAIGDYGHAGAAAHDVARLVAGWRPDLVVTTGDNNYPRGEEATIDLNVGRYYHRFISLYQGAYGSGARRNRFFPALGNHDLIVGGGRAHLDYFTLPGNERYFDFMAGPVHFFALNSNPREPDGTSEWSTQRRWLRQRLGESQAPWRVVYFHHAPYSSGRKRRRATWMRWPFAAWGADVVLAGHEHVYERLTVDGIAYFVVGLGGAPIYDFGEDVAHGSRIRFNRDYGALLGSATLDELSLTFTTRRSEIIDRYQLRADRAGTAPTAAVDP